MRERVVVQENPQAAEIAYWNSIKNSNRNNDYQTYLNKYPNGLFVEVAQAKLQPKVEIAQVQLRERPVTAPAAIDTYAVGKSFKDCASGCPEMVVVPPGSFVMGSPRGSGSTLAFHEAARQGPQHTVNINYKLAVGKYELTFEEWDACVADGGCNGYRPDDQGWGHGRRPVMNVSWEDAQAYVQWLSRKTGMAYRLLTESEWEYMARAGTTTLYSWGDKVGNCLSCGSQWEDKQAAPVGSFAANSFGLYDVYGNVWEWVEDCYEDGYDGAPVDGSARSSCTGDNAGMRVLRGGAWNATYTHSARRNRDTSTIRVNYYGFRVARRL